MVDVYLGYDMEGYDKLIIVHDNYEYPPELATDEMVGGEEYCCNGVPVSACCGKPGGRWEKGL